MAVHGRYREPCRTCGAPIQRIRYRGERGQLLRALPDGGKVLADRSLSRLLKDNWPRRIEDLEG
jgi:formamidopyrimidine-DNA glycosylase